MKIYHVSFELVPQTKHFVPCTPRTIGSSNENREIERICFSETVDGCLSAIPGADTLLLEKGHMFLLYEVDTADLKETDYISNEQIVKKNYVYDAEMTKECWVLKEMTLTGRYAYVRNYDFKDYFFPTEENREEIYENYAELREVYTNIPSETEMDEYPIVKLVNEIVNPLLELGDYDWLYDICPHTQKISFQEFEYMVDDEQG